MKHTIHAADLVLRLWTQADTTAIVDIAAASKPEFDSWLPGLMSDLADPDAFLAYVERTAAGETGWNYGIEIDGTVVGQCSINARDNGAAEIGYWVRTDRTNEGIATGAVRAVSEAARRHGFTSLIIHCDEGNGRSAAVARKAGFEHLRTDTLDPSLPGTSVQTGREMTWRLDLRTAE